MHTFAIHLYQSGGAGNTLQGRATFQRDRVWWEPQKVQQKQTQVRCPECNNSVHEHRLGNDWHPGGQQVDHGSATAPYVTKAASSGSREVILPLYMVLVRPHLEQCLPELGSPVQESHGLPRGSTTEGHQRRSGLQHPLHWGEAEWAVPVQPGEEKVQGWLQCCLQRPGQRTQRSQSQTLLRGARWQDKRQQIQAGTWEILIRYKYFSARGWSNTGTWRDCGISVLGGVQDSAGHNPEQSDPIRLSLSSGLDQMISRGLFQSMLYF